MNLGAKFLTTVLVGTAVGLVIYQYLQTPEGERALENLKDRADDLRDEAEEAVDRAPEYLEQIRTRAEQVLNNNLPEAEQFLRDLVASLSGKKTGGLAA
ncbi:YtxH domain-containing protein [Telluribacter sp.]|jgi:hypothetical protein|uniref:YtxH domain-containing protein n=1 Tax=Telluribacter sp. TaxID=1978767 RepID=UPI002E135B7F|nr:YtxH domain-containing protein [Telluribacter sp.]